MKEFAAQYFFFFFFFLKLGRIRHIPGGRAQRSGRGHGSASVLAGGDQRGGAPPAADTAECAPHFY